MSATRRSDTHESADGEERATEGDRRHASLRILLARKTPRQFRKLALGF